MSGTRSPSAARTRRAASNTNGTAASTSIGPRRATAAPVRTGRWMTGPSPRANSSPPPRGSTINRISANRIAASTPRRSTGWSVTSAAASGFRHISRKPNRSRIARYSGMYRPAWRMSQTGVCGTGSRRAARRNGASSSDTQESLSSAAMPYISGKQAFLEILKSEGVSVMFGNPGTTELPLMDGLAREPGIHYVLALQEAVAIAMADGYAQASGGLAAVNVHVSPGLGNAMGMLYDAKKSGAPMLLTAGQHDQSFNVTEPILWSDLPPVARPWVKWSTEAHRLEDLPRIVRRAAKTALAHPSGPVFLSLPVDVLNAERDLELGAPTRVAPRLRGDRAAVDEAARLLAGAKRPLVVAGDAVAQGGGIAELIEVAELLGAPVRLEGM